MAAPEQTAVEVRITGRVQGVWFRGWTREEATHLGLSGWVRNERDGSVLARFQGPADKIARMLDLCREGPPMARVIAVTPREIAPDPGLTGFSEIR